MANLIILFNHRLTATQITDAKKSLNIKKIIIPPDDLRILWANIPPDIPDLTQSEACLALQDWLENHGSDGDYVLIQGDFGATYIMVQFAFKQRFIPIYSTTKREAEEKHATDNTVNITHRFSHVQFRCYQIQEEK